MEVDAVVAAAADIEVLAAMCDAAAEELRPHRGGEMWHRREARPAPHGAALAAMLTDPDRHLVLAGRIDEVAVGYAVASVVELNDASRVADLTDLYVLPEARGVGVGEAMMGEVTTWARRTGCLGIDALALPGDRETKNFFESFGLVARALRVHRAID